MKPFNVARKYGAKVGAGVAAGAASLLLAMGQAHAELPLAVGSTVSAIQGDATDIFGLVFPVVGLVLGFVILIKLFKKFTNKI